MLKRTLIIALLAIPAGICGWHVLFDGPLPCPPKIQCHVK